jgi:NAD(P)-dependent dehydrogenase (short-subunit alcohol dehydrogenase family)
MAKRNQHTLHDPRTLYKPLEIPKQRQPEPGLDEALSPQADHGEESYEGSGKLTGRRALITGGDSGIGRAVAIAFAREGADVAINFLPEEKEDALQTAGLIEAAGQKALLIEGDLMDESFCKSLVKEVADTFGGLDILVNNAAKQVYINGIEELTTKELDATFKTNIYAMFWLVKAALPHMPKGSTIINTTSIQSYQPSATLLHYASTKGAITSFTKGLAESLLEKGIRVNGVAPGPIWTPLQPSHGQPMEKLVEFGKQSPMGRPGQPAELAPAYVFLASGESSYITGEIIGVTGGSPIS